MRRQAARPFGWKGPPRPAAVRTTRPARTAHPYQPADRAAGPRRSARVRPVPGSGPAPAQARQQDGQVALGARILDRPVLTRRQRAGQPDEQQAHVAERDVRTDRAVSLRVADQGGDRGDAARPQGGELGVITVQRRGDRGHHPPDPHPHRLAQVAGQRLVAVRLLGQRPFGRLGGAPDHLHGDGVQQRAAVREMPVQGGVPHPRGPGDLIERDLRALFGDELRGPREQRLAVAAPVGPRQPGSGSRPIRGIHSHIECIARPPTTKEGGSRGQ